MNKKLEVLAGGFDEDGNPLYLIKDTTDMIGNIEICKKVIEQQAKIKEQNKEIEDWEFSFRTEMAHHRVAEKELKEKLGCDAVIHMDPLEVDNEIVSEMRTELASKIEAQYPGVTIHDFRMVQGPSHTNLIFDAVVPFEFALSNEEVKIGIENLVEENWENYFAVVVVEQSYV